MKMNGCTEIKKISALMKIENKAITLVVEETKISFFAFYRPYERCRSSSHKNMQHWTHMGLHRSGALRISLSHLPA
jgi:hypothetical protein